jgi:hypothetical protein
MLMRCFYCGQPGRKSSNEHVPSAFLGSRLKTRKVCGPCNQRAGKEIDDPLAAYVMVNMPKALSDVRNLRHQEKVPKIEVGGVVSTTGERVTVRFSPGKREALRSDGSPVEQAVEISYPADSDLWVRFSAKVALGCAAQVFDDDWLDEPAAVAARAVLWQGKIDPNVWPAGLPGWPEELGPRDPVREALGDARHLIGLAKADDEPQSSVAVAFLFGGQISCRLPLPGIAVPGSGLVWIIDWHPARPPVSEDFDQAVERLLRERGWTPEQIDAARIV